MSDVGPQRWDHIASLRTSSERIQDDDGNTRLMQAVLTGNLMLVKSNQCENKAEINQQRLDGKTALHLACLLDPETLEIVKYLTEEGSDVDTKDALCYVPIFYAIEKGHHKTTMYLINHGCSLEIPTPTGDTVLHSACFHGVRIEVLKHLVKNKCDIDAKNEVGITPLMVASRAGHLSIVKFLINHDADRFSKDINGRNPVHHCCLGDQDSPDILRLLNIWYNLNEEDLNGQTPLIYAVENGKVRLLECLISLNYNVVCHRDKSTGWTPLHWVSRAPEDEAVKLAEILVDAGVDKETKDLSLRTPLMCCVNEGQIQVVKFLLDLGVSVKGETKGYNFTALHLAAMSERDRADMVQMLITAGCSVNPQSSKNFYSAIPTMVTPLMLAAQCGNTNMVRELLKNNAMMSLTDSVGGTALHYACIGNDQVQNKIVIDFLLEASPNREITLNKPTQEGKSPIYLAATHGKLKILEHLLVRGADVNLKNTKEQKTALTEVCDLNHPAKGIEDIVKVLLKNGAEVNTTDKRSHTPLIKAVLKGHSVVVDMLVTAGAVVTHKDVEGKTALHYACSTDHTTSDILNILVKNGASINVKDNYQWTPLLYAVSSNNLVSVKYLVKHGADLHVVDKQNRSLMHIACSGRKDAKDLVRELIEYRCHVNIKSIDEKKPLDIALKNRHLHSAELIIRTAGLHREAVKLIDHEIFCDCLQKGLDEVVSKVPFSIVSQFVKKKLTGKGLYPIHLVSNVEQLKFLKTCGANTKVTCSEKGYTVLHYKVLDLLWQETNNLVRLLREVDPNMKDEEGKTALHVLCCQQNDSLVTKDKKNPDDVYLENARKLIEAKADVNLQDANKETPLNIALKARIEKMVVLIDSQNGLLYDENGGRQQVMQYIAQQWDKYQETNNNAEAFVKSLIEDNIDINCVKSKGQTPLFYAAQCKNAYLAKFLSEKNCFVLTNDGVRLPLLQWIVYSSEVTDLPEKLLKYMTIKNVNQKDPQGRTVLHYMAMLLQSTKVQNNNSDHEQLKGKFDECLIHLLDKDAAIDEQDLNGDTPLMLSVRYGFHQMTSLLVRQGANMQVRNHRGLSCLSIGGDGEILKMVTQHSTVMTHCLESLRQAKEALKHYPKEVSNETEKKELHDVMGSLISKMFNFLIKDDCEKVTNEKHLWVFIQNYDELVKCMEPTEVIHMLVAKR